MLEIQPLSPFYPVIKPGKIKKDDTPSRQQQRNKPEPEEQEEQPAQHIDEVA
jgi:hypothetical protein